MKMMPTLGPCKTSEVETKIGTMMLANQQPKWRRSRMLLEYEHFAMSGIRNVPSSVFRLRAGDGELLLLRSRRAFLEINKITGVLDTGSDCPYYHPATR